MGNQAVKELQIWLNSKGQSLVTDGVGGPATQRALIAAFTNPAAPAATQAELSRVAARLGGSLKQLAAVAKVESGGSGYFKSGLPKLLWERHYFWRRIQVIIPWISNPAPGDYTTDQNKNNINDSWEKLALAACRNPQAAFESCSWGQFQIMGAHWKALGYPSVFAFAWAIRESGLAHYEALERYIKANNMIAAFRAISTDAETCRAFAKGYNGKGYEKFSYHKQLAEAMK